MVLESNLFGLQMTKNILFTFTYADTGSNSFKTLIPLTLLGFVSILQKITTIYLFSVRI